MFCTRCDWHKNKYVNCAGFYGDPSANIVFCGEAYGSSEAEVNEPFVGTAGQKFNMLLQEADLTREEVVIMNAIRCYQLHNPTPTHRQLDACHFHTWKDIQTINPKLVVAMGGSALYSLTGKEGVSNYRGKLLYSEKIGRRVYVTFHPAACIHDPTKWEVLQEDFKRIPSLVDKNPDEIKHYPYELITTADQFGAALPRLFDNIVYFDLETTGLSPYTEEITLLQLGNGKDVYVIDASVLPNIKEGLRLLFSKSPVVGQDFSFDAKFLAVKLGILPSKWEHDCCLAEFVVSGMKDNDLEYLTSKYVPESFGYDEAVKLVGGAHKIKNKDVLLQYSADDIGVLPKIRRVQTKMLMREEMHWLFKNITMPCNKVLTKMSLRGVLYDTKALMKVDKKYEKRAEKALLKLQTVAGVSETEQHFRKKFNPRSSDHIKWLLIEYYKLPVLKTTKKHHNPSIGKNEMKKYAKAPHNNPYCKIMDQYRSYQNIRDNFLSGVIPKLIDGVAHTNFSLHAVASGRPNSKDPNLLNIPAEEDIRRCIIARPGHTFVHADLKQIEVRVAAMLSEDEGLIKICNDIDKDFHSMIASNISGMPYNEFYGRYLAGEKKIEDERRAAKATTFGILFQEGAIGLAYNLGISETKAQKFIDDYYSPFPKLYEYIEGIKQFVIENGWVETYFHFRRRWRDHTAEDHGTLREGVNHGIQGGAWNLLQLIMIEVDKRLEGMESALVTQVYDSIVVEALESEVSAVVGVVKSSIEEVNLPYPKLNRVRVVGDIEVGPNLTDLTKF